MKTRLLCALLICNVLSAEITNPVNYINPRGDCFIIRQVANHAMTVAQSAYNIANEHNGDDTNVAGYAGSFTKTLEHDGTTGLPTATGQLNYERLLTALNSGVQSDFEAIVRAPGATRLLANPQAAHARSLVGVPCSILSMPSAPEFTSAHAAADIIEVYLKMLCRDVRFEDYGTGANTDVDAVNGGSLTNNAAAVLTALGTDYKGPRSGGGPVTAAELFRGTSVGDIVGPYVSQFWWLPTYRVSQALVEQPAYVPVAQDREFGVSVADFVAIQNGTVPEAYIGSDFSGQRHVITGRDGATSVHGDMPAEYFFKAVNILLNNSFSLAANFPYNDGSITNEGAFVTMMVTDINTALFVASQEALKHAWAHKWLGNRKLRPEEMGGRIHNALATSTNTLGLHSYLYPTAVHDSIDVWAWVNAHNVAQEGVTGSTLGAGDGNTYLLAQVYPEGSPTHPSYPAGHAVMAGACATVVKAFFDDTALMSAHVTPVKPDPADPTALITLPNGEDALIITVGGELDKLASNIALSRNFAGVHYRSDGDEGIALGEQVAIKMLQDWAHIYSEQCFAGFELTKRDGQRIRITAEGVTNI